MKRAEFILLVLFISLILSCNDSTSRKSNMTMVIPETANDNIPSPQASEIDIDRKIIKEGNLIFETRDIKATRKSIERKTLELKGYIAKESVWTYENKIENTLDLRVPAENFDLLISGIAEDVENIDSKNVDLQDVTEEFIDVQARLKTKKELETRYLELLRKAVKVEEILSIEKEIGNLRSEIESVEGRLKYLNNRTSFSKLSVTYYQKIKSPFQFSSKFRESIKGGWRNMLWFFIGITNLWPFIVFGGIILLVVTLVRRKKKNEKKS